MIMTRQQLSQDIADRYYSMMKDCEPDTFEMVQAHWERALTLWDTKTPEEFSKSLTEGPWRDRELNRFCSQLSVYKELMDIQSLNY